MSEILSKTPTYSCWLQMRARCNNPRHSSYPSFGGRGIKVCERWNRFANFYADMGERPANLQIERLDNDGDFRPDNCKWATRSEKGYNKLNNRRYITLDGVSKTFGQWAEYLGLDRSSLWERLQKWPLEKALTTPKKRGSVDKTRYGRNWYTARKAAVTASGGKCQRCREAKPVHVHHRIPVRYFKVPEDANHPENLMAVCHPCHVKEHEEMAARFPLLDTLEFTNSSRRSHRDIARFITWNGQTKRLTEWAKMRSGPFPVQWLSNRLRRMPFEKAMEPFS